MIYRNWRKVRTLECEHSFIYCCRFLCAFDMSVMIPVYICVHRPVMGVHFAEHFICDNDTVEIEAVCASDDNSMSSLLSPRQMQQQ